MEKEKLSTELRGLVGENSLSERTWNGYLEQSVMPFLPSEEDKRGDYLSKHANALKSISGQLNNEVATRVNDFKKNYVPDQPKPETEPKLHDANGEKLTDLEIRLQKFEKAEAEKQAAKAKADKLTEVKKLMMEEGSTNETVIRLILPQLDVREDSTAKDLAKSGKNLYDKTYKDLYGDSYVPAFGGSYGGGGKKDKEDYMKHLKETGRITD